MAYCQPESGIAVTVDMGAYETYVAPKGAVLILR